MARAVDVKLEGFAAAVEALALVSKEAAFAQKSAVRAAGTRGVSLTAKALAVKTGVIGKVWRKRCKHYPGRRTNVGLATRRLWLGLKHPPRAKEHASVEAALPKLPGTFEQTMRSGHKGLFRRRFATIPYGPGARKHPKERRNLPIDEGRIDVSDIAERTLIKAGTEAMRERYVEVLSKEMKRRLKNKIIK